MGVITVSGTWKYRLYSLRIKLQAAVEGQGSQVSILQIVLEPRMDRRKSTCAYKVNLAGNSLQ